MLPSGVRKSQSGRLSIRRLSIRRLSLKNRRIGLMNLTARLILSDTGFLQEQNSSVIV